MELQELRNEIVRRIIRLDTQNQSPKLSHEETQYIRGQIAALRSLGHWNPEAKEEAQTPEDELDFGIHGNDSTSMPVT